MRRQAQPATQQELHLSRCENRAENLESRCIRAKGPSDRGKATLFNLICILLREEASHSELNYKGQTGKLSLLAGSRQMRQLPAYSLRALCGLRPSPHENHLLCAAVC